MSASKPAPDASGRVRERPANEAPKAPTETPREPEIGGPSGPEPTRYGDWERKGRCIDF